MKEQSGFLASVFWCQSFTNPVDGAAKAWQSLPLGRVRFTTLPVGFLTSITRSVKLQYT